MGACPSPSLIAACHVLHRLEVPRHPPCALSSLTIKFTHEQPASCVTLRRLHSKTCLVCVSLSDIALTHKDMNTISDNSHYSIVKDLLQFIFRRRENAQNSTFTSINYRDCLNAQLRAVNLTNRFGVSALVESDSLSVALTLEIICSSSPRVERARQLIGGGEGVRTPDLRLAKPALCQTELRPLPTSEKVGCGGGI